MNRDTSGSGSGVPLRCAEARVLLMGYLDGEIGSGEARQVEDHMAVCPACRSEAATFRQMGAAADQLAGEEITVNTDLAWEKIYDRLARGLGWVLLWVGLTLMAGYGFWVLGAELLTDPEIPLVMRVGIGAFAVGVLLLAISVLRERLYRNRTERYREVQR